MICRRDRSLLGNSILSFGKCSRRAVFDEFRVPLWVNCDTWSQLIDCRWIRTGPTWVIVYLVNDGTSMYRRRGAVGGGVVAIVHGSTGKCSLTVGR